MAQKTAPQAETHRSVPLLQNTMDDLTSRIADHPKSSLAVRLARAARADIPAATVEKLFVTLRAAIDDAQATYERAANTPRKKAAAAPIEVPSRVSLA